MKLTGTGWALKYETKLGKIHQSQKVDVRINFLILSIKTSVHFKFNTSSSIQNIIDVVYEWL